MKHSDLEQLRNNFVKWIAMLNNSNTRNKAYDDLKRNVNDNKTAKALRVYINSIVSHYSDLYDAKAKELIVILFGYIANVFRSEFRDPLDKEPSVFKTCKRVVMFIKNYPMKEKEYVVHKACSYTLIELFDLCCCEKKEQEVFEIFIGQFIEVVEVGRNLYARDAACVYVNDFIFHLANKQNGNVANVTSIKLITSMIMSANFITIICKKINTYDNEFLYESLYNILRYFPIEEVVSKYIQEIINKIIHVLNQYALDSSSIKKNSAINCVNILGLIGTRPQAREQASLISDAIKPCLNDKDRQLRKSARDAIREYDDIIKEQALNGKGEDYEKLKLSMKNRVKNGIVSDMAQYDSEITEKMKSEIYNKGIGDLLKLSKFIKEHAKMNMDSKKERKSKLNPNETQKYDKKEYMPFEYQYDNSFNKATENQNNTNTYIEYSNNNLPLTESENFYKYIDISSIKKSFANLNKTFSVSQRKITSSIFSLETKLEHLTSLLETHQIAIIKSHNNILDETLVSTSDVKTESINDTNSNCEVPPDNVTDAYLISISLLNKGQIEKSFQNILSQGDDIYLIRLLLLLNKDITKNIPSKIFKEILVRLNKINRSFFIEKIFFNLIEDAKINLQLFTDISTVKALFEGIKELTQYKNKDITNRAKVLIKALRHYKVINN